MTVIKIPCTLPEETIAKLMEYGRMIDHELQKIVGQPVVYALVLSLEIDGGLLMHRMANTDVTHARQLFALAGNNAMEPQFVRTMQDH